ncbi:unnamed protein product [Tenebrio molitor]|nr:unnamed protein product [Tenebrio molitor]
MWAETRSLFAPLFHDFAYHFTTAFYVLLFNLGIVSIRKFTKFIW